MLKLATRRQAKNSAERAEDSVLGLLASSLPGHWLIIGLVPPRPFKSGRKRTREMDAIVITERYLFAVEIKSHGGHIRASAGKPFQRNGVEIADRTNQPAGFWYHHDQSVYVLKALLKERFALASERVVPKMLWSAPDSIHHGESGLGRDVIDARTFATIAAEKERSSRLPLLDQRLRIAIACFLADEPAQAFEALAQAVVPAQRKRTPPRAPSQAAKPSPQASNHSPPFPQPPPPPPPHPSWSTPGPPVFSALPRGPSLHSITGADWPSPAQASPVTAQEGAPTINIAASGSGQQSSPLPAPSTPARDRAPSLEEAVGALVPNGSEAYSVTVGPDEELKPTVARLVQILADKHRDCRVLVVHPEGRTWSPWYTILKLCGDGRVGLYHTSASWACDRPEQIVVASVGAVTSVTNFTFENHAEFWSSLEPFAIVIAVESDLMASRLWRIRPGPFTMLHISQLPNLSYVTEKRIPHLAGPRK